MNLYKNIITDHFRNPRHKGPLTNPDFATQLHNPSCGDSISMQGIIAEGQLTQIGFNGQGCMISQATASLLAEYCLGKLLHEIVLFDKQTVQGLLGIELGPLRLKCALLPLQVLHQGVRSYQSQQKGTDAGSDESSQRVRSSC